MTDPQNKPSQIGFDSLEWQKRLSILEEEVSNLSAANFNGFIEEDLIEIDGIVIAPGFTETIVVPIPEATDTVFMYRVYAVGATEDQLPAAQGLAMTVSRNSVGQLKGGTGHQVYDSGMNNFGAISMDVGKLTAFPGFPGSWELVIEKVILPGTGGDVGLSCKIQRFSMTIPFAT